VPGLEGKGKDDGWFVGGFGEGRPEGKDKGLGAKAAKIERGGRCLEPWPGAGCRGWGWGGWAATPWGYAD
jgi:hypothetical protein